MNKIRVLSASLLLGLLCSVTNASAGTTTPQGGGAELACFTKFAQCLMGGNIGQCFTDLQQCLKDGGGDDGDGGDGGGDGDGGGGGGGDGGDFPLRG